MPTESMEAPCCKPADEVGVIEKESKTHSYKAVTQIKVPEVILCFNDGACQVVKDICIDEGLHPLDKILLENNAVSEKISSVLKSYVKHANDDPGGRMDNGAALINKDLKSTSSLEKDSVDHKSFWSSSEAREIPSILEKDVSNIPEKKISLEELLSMAETDSGPRHAEQEKSSKVSPEFSLCTRIWTPFSCDFDSTCTMLTKDDVQMGTSLSFDATQSSQASEKEESLVNLTGEDYSINPVMQSGVIVARQSSSIHENDVINRMDSGDNDTASKDDVQMGMSSSFDAIQFSRASGREESLVNLTGEDYSIKTLLHSDAVVAGQTSSIHENDVINTMDIGINNTDARCGSTTSKSSEESGADKDSESSSNRQNPSVTEETVTDSTAASKGCSFHNNNQEELNSSGPSYLSGPKVSSGHIAFSGSISLRSDSSTTSTRSFAFPVLQSEWNNSPVKMVKADRRHLKKHRCWGVQLLCCKF